MAATVGWCSATTRSSRRSAGVGLDVVEVLRPLHEEPGPAATQGGARHHRAVVASVALRPPYEGAPGGVDAGMKEEFEGVAHVARRQAVFARPLRLYMVTVGFHGKAVFFFEEDRAAGGIEVIFVPRR